MAVGPKRRTQTAEYWSEEFAASKDDLVHIYEWLVEKGEPGTIEELTVGTIERRCSREEEALLKRGDKAAVYQPQDEYEVGQRVLLPAFDYLAGQVLAVRDGENPRYAPFKVIRVQLENESTPREFAAGLSTDHALRGSAAMLMDEDLLSAPQLYELYGSYVQERLEDALSASEDFMQLGEYWYLRGLVPEVTPFHLNIAEAMIDERAQPLTVTELLKEMEFSSGVTSSVQAYALNHALSQDSRFVEMSVDGAPAWYLSDLIPEGVREMPMRLIATHRTRGGEWLNRELIDFVLEIGDELDQLKGMPVTSSQTADSVQILLNYPHRREGTLAFNARALELLSERPADRFMVTFVDRRTKEQISGWVRPDDGYASGLGDWYDRLELPIGAVLELRKGSEPFTFEISCAQGNRRTEWIRQANAHDGQLTFSMQRKAYSCRCDKHLLIDVARAEALDDLWTPTEEARSLFGLLLVLFPELAKLSGQGLVHAKTLYSAVNLTRRCGAVPVFAELTSQACFDPVGDGNWVLDESLVDVQYKTPEEMSRRPSSHRPEMIVDRVYPYAAGTEGQVP